MVDSLDNPQLPDLKDAVQMKSKKRELQTDETVAWLQQTELILTINQGCKLVRGEKGDKLN